MSNNKIIVFIAGAAIASVFTLYEYLQTQKSSKAQITTPNPAPSYTEIYVAPPSATASVYAPSSASSPSSTNTQQSSGSTTSGSGSSGSGSSGGSGGTVGSSGLTTAQISSAYAGAGNYAGTNGTPIYIGSLAQFISDVQSGLITL